MKTIMTDNNEKKKRTVIWLFFLIYIAVLLKLTVFRPGFGTYEHFSGKLNLELFTNYIPIIAEGHWFDFIYLFFGNIVWFIPWGLFFCVFLKKSACISILSGMLLSISIEVVQFVFAVGDAEIDDVVLNTIGVAIGCLLGFIFHLRSSKSNHK